MLILNASPSYCPGPMKQLWKEMLHSLMLEAVTRGRADKDETQWFQLWQAIWASESQGAGRRRLPTFHLDLESTKKGIWSVLIYFFKWLVFEMPIKQSSMQFDISKTTESKKIQVLTTSCIFTCRINSLKPFDWSKQFYVPRLWKLTSMTALLAFGIFRSLKAWAAGRILNLPYPNKSLDTSLWFKGCEPCIRCGEAVV